MSNVQRSDWRRYDSIRSEPPVSGGMTVGHLREFVHTLGNHGVPDSTLLAHEHAHDTHHLVSVSVRVEFTVPMHEDPTTEGTDR